MKVQLITESSGFGYNPGIANWMVESEENLAKIQNLKTGHAVEIPEKIAKMILNLVNLETGEIISKRSSVYITTEEVKQKYLKKELEVQSKARKALKEVSESSIKHESIELVKAKSVSDFGKIKPLNDEET